MPSQHCRATIVLKQKGQLWRIYGAISMTCFQAFAWTTPISDLSLPAIERHLVCRPLHHYLPISQHLMRYYLHRRIQHRLIQPMHRHGCHHHSHRHGRHHHSHLQSVRHHRGLPRLRHGFVTPGSMYLPIGSYIEARTVGRV